MPDPAFLMLLEHLNRPPPAISRAAPVELSSPSVEAYAKYVSAQEQELNTWTSQGDRLRSELWRQVKLTDSGLSYEFLSDAIERFEFGLRLEARILSRIEKRARRDEKYLDARERDEVSRQHRRLIDVGKRFYFEGLEFAAFLRALRAEVDTESRGGNAFEAPEDLEQSILAELRKA